MNKIVASLGLAAIGASSVQAIYAADELGAPANKIWNVSLSLRGFYDDNINTTHSAQVSSLGYEVNPGVGLNWSGESTTATFDYNYSFKYYDQRPAGQADKFDQTHILNAMVQHIFSPRYQVAVNDSFVIGQEPDALRLPVGGAIDNAQRVSGDNIRNYGGIVFDAVVTPTFNLEFNYNNVYFNYEAGFDAAIQPVGTPGATVVPSNSGLLDRVENLASFEGHWLFRPSTTGILGYQYGQVLYLGDELIGGFYNGIGGVINPEVSDDRNSRSQYIYVGAKHQFSPEVKAEIRAGVQYTDYYNDTVSGDSTQLSPYVRASITGRFNPRDSWSLGFSQARSPANQAGVNPVTGDFTKDTDVSVLYGQLNHSFSRRISGSVLGTFQNSIYNGGTIDGDMQQYYELGLNLQYHFNSNFGTEVGYSFDAVTTDLPDQSYNRNRVYLGVFGVY